MFCFDGVMFQAFWMQKNKTWLHFSFESNDRELVILTQLYQYEEVVENVYDFIKIANNFEYFFINKFLFCAIVM